MTDVFNKEGCSMLGTDMERIKAEVERAMQKRGYPENLSMIDDVNLFDYDYFRLDLHFLVQWIKIRCRTYLLRLILKCKNKIKIK